MQVDIDKDFPYPTLFLVAGRAAGTAAPPVEPVGVFIARQRLQTNGHLDPQQPDGVLMMDETYPVDPPPDPLPGDPPPDPLPDPPPERPQPVMRFESDLVPTKPALDLVVVRKVTESETENAEPKTFGQVRIRRRNRLGPVLQLDYGWRDRQATPRKAAAGQVKSFEPVAISDPANPPPLIERLALPTGFENQFFNGSPLFAIEESAERLERIETLPHLTMGDRVDFLPEHSGVRRASAIIPPAPRLAIQQQGAPIAPPVPITLGVDTVVYDQSNARILLTWRGVFPWSDRLENATLVVS